MLFNKWLISPVLSLLVAVPTMNFVQPKANAQTNWIEVGRNNEGEIVRMNPELKVSGAVGSVVMYELLIELNPPLEGLYRLKTEVLAQCESKSYALSSSEGLDQQGRVIQSDTVPYADMDWQTPANDVYGKAFRMACESR